MVADNILRFIGTLGKGPGFVLFAMGTAAGLFALAWYGRDVSQITGPLGVIAGGLYGGGFLKAFADRASK
jgi:hypothetical protein